MSILGEIKCKDLNELMELIHRKCSVNIIYLDAVCQAPGMGETSRVKHKLSTPSGEGRKSYS